MCNVLVINSFLVSLQLLRVIWPRQLRLCHDRILFKDVQVEQATFERGLLLICSDVLLFHAAKLCQPTGNAL